MKISVSFITFYCEPKMAIKKENLLTLYIKYKYVYILKINQNRIPVLNRALAFQYKMSCLVISTVKNKYIPLIVH